MASAVLKECCVPETFRIDLNNQQGDEWYWHDERFFRPFHLRNDEKMLLAVKERSQQVLETSPTVTNLLYNTWDRHIRREWFVKTEKLENDRNFDLSLPPLFTYPPRFIAWSTSIRLGKRDPRGHETIRMAAFFLRNSTKLHISHAMTLGKIKKGFLLLPLNSTQRFLPILMDLP